MFFRNERLVSFSFFTPTPPSLFFPTPSPFLLCTFPRRCFPFASNAPWASCQLILCASFSFPFGCQGGAKKGGQLFPLPRLKFVFLSEIACDAFVTQRSSS